MKTKKMDINHPFTSKPHTSKYVTYLGRVGHGSKPNVRLLLQKQEKTKMRQIDINHTQDEIGHGHKPAGRGQTKGWTVEERQESVH
jgi:hypothetical protein